jgi:hypothetical protein
MTYLSFNLQTGSVTTESLSEQQLAFAAQNSIKTYTKEEQQEKRALAYAAEADPLYFKAQRQEGTFDTWLAKVEEIRLRYPYPDDSTV